MGSGSPYTIIQGENEVARDGTELESWEEALSKRSQPYHKGEKAAKHYSKPKWDGAGTHSPKAKASEEVLSLIDKLTNSPVFG